MRGIIGAERLVCARIAAFPPPLAAGRHRAQRLRRLLRGETTQRAPLDAEAVVAALQAQGVAQLRDEPSRWVLGDGSDLRKPHARELPFLQRVKRLDGAGTVPGYPTLNVLGIGPTRRGVRYHRL